MRIVTDIGSMHALMRGAGQKRRTVGFVPTMGALHEGHLSLIRAARKENDFVAVSVFVNPAQFGPKEDFKRYPRPFRRDAALCRKAGVDFLFCPSAEDMYPDLFSSYVHVEGVSERLCGACRPGHFRGVATVVAKLFNIIGPCRAYFGQKDAQQVFIISRMIQDLNFPVKVRILPTVRQSNGLALSSRNTYLSASDKLAALVVPRALQTAGELIAQGKRDASGIIAAMKRLIASESHAKIDYIAVLDPATFLEIKKIKHPCMIALAVWIGKTRLIDNTIYG